MEIAERLGVDVGVVRRMEARVFNTDVSLAEIEVTRDHPGLVVESHERQIDHVLDGDRLMKRIEDAVAEMYWGRDYKIVMAWISGKLTSELYADLVDHQGITIERVRQILRDAALKLRTALESDGISGIGEISLAS